MASRRAFVPPHFQSFIQGGFECAYPKINENTRLDLLQQTKHEKYCIADYQLLKEVGMLTVREGLAWNEIDRGMNNYDFSRFEPLMAAGKAAGVQQIWDLNHFDYPDDLDPFSSAFVDRFARYAAEAIKYILQYSTGTVFIVPWNEISFFALIGADWGAWAPFAKERGFELKKQLVRASLAAMDAIWAVDSSVRFIQVDPIFYRRAKPPITPATRDAARAFKEIKMQAWDMLCGKIEPELGGAAKYLDIIGCNYYYYNQEYVFEQNDSIAYKTIPWNSRYRISSVSMYQEVYERYHRPLVITETGGWGELRRIWWRRTLRELTEALDQGLPIYGVCAYPIIDRPDWTDGHLTNSGLWDFAADDPLLRRIPHEYSINLLRTFGQAVQRHEDARH